MSQKKLSLQEQLLKAGLVTEAQARTAKSDKYKANQRGRNANAAVANETKELAQKAQAEQTARDKELNRLKQEQEAQKQAAAQVRQLIVQHRLQIDDDAVDRYDDSFAYHFIDQGKIKKLFVPEDIRQLIADGRLAVVRLGRRYEIVKVDIADKIKARAPDCVVVHNQSPGATSVDGNGPYADYQIPDDLIW